jgi:hypothetical protein
MTAPRLVDPDLGIAPGTHRRAAATVTEGPPPPARPKVAGRKPQRIQRKRTKGSRIPETAIYVGRGRGKSGRWGNPYKVGNGVTHAGAVAQFAEWLARPEQADLVTAARRELAGHDLACWCAVTEACHGDVWLAIVNGGQW